MCGLFAAIFQGQSNNNHTVHQVYVYIIKVRHVCLPCALPVSLPASQTYCMVTCYTIKQHCETHLLLTPISLCQQCIMLRMCSCMHGPACDCCDSVPERLCLLQVLVCIFLWLIVDVIKTMAAKLMAGHFHQETYFQRMQEALRKVLLPSTQAMCICICICEKGRPSSTWHEHSISLV